MRRNITRITLFATLFLSLAVVAPAQEGHWGYCSSWNVAGTWAYTETGTIILPAPTGAVPYASMGKYTLEVNGNLSGERTASAGGTIQKAAFKGTATVNPDCTGTVTVRFYDQSGNLLSPTPTVKDVVYVDNATEARMIITSGSFPTVLTAVAKKLFVGPGSLGR